MADTDGERLRIEMPAPPFRCPECGLPFWSAECACTGWAGTVGDGTYEPHPPVPVVPAGAGDA